MQNVHIIETAYCQSQKSTIRSAKTPPEILAKSIKNLGEEFAKTIIEKYHLSEKKIQTPMEHSIDALMPDYLRSVVITTKDDFLSLGTGISQKLENVLNGYMNFEGRRGPEALDSMVRDMDLPNSKDEPVTNLIIGKAVLATGCTAISLTKEAVRKYLPRRVILVSIFYSKRGVSEVLGEIPNADIFLINGSDDINEDGMLIPGIGNLDQRLHRGCTS